MARLYTARIYNINRVEDWLDERGLLEETKLVCVMRHPWRYIPKKSGVITIKQLGPPLKLHIKTQRLLKDEEYKDSEQLQLDHQISYSIIYTLYLEGKLEEDPEPAILWVLNLLRNVKLNVVLLCGCNSGEFCHRLILYQWLINALGKDYAGGEIDLNKIEQENFESVKGIQTTL